MCGSNGRREWSVNISSGIEDRFEVDERSSCKEYASVVVNWAHFHACSDAARAYTVT